MKTTDFIKRAIGVPDYATHFPEYKPDTSTVKTKKVKAAPERIVVGGVEYAPIQQKKAKAPSRTVSFSFRITRDLESKINNLTQNSSYWTRSKIAHTAFNDFFDNLEEVSND